MSCTDRFNIIRTEVPSNVKIVAVSKTKPASSVEELYRNTGHKMFGENKAQELNAKQGVLPMDIEWHFIGHLQTNKIEYIAPYVALIQSVDSFKLLAEINKEAIKCNRVIPCLLQFHIASEEAKFGFTFDEARQMLEDKLYQQLLNVSITGVMGMATFTDNTQQISSAFKTLFSYFTDLKSKYFPLKHHFYEVSMGMTDDYKIAIAEGSTIIRVGSGIFGGR
jgi:hypothetical protein